MDFVVVALVVVEVGVRAEGLNGGKTKDVPELVGHLQRLRLHGGAGPMVATSARTTLDHRSGSGHPNSGVHKVSDGCILGSKDGIMGYLLATGDYDDSNWTGSCL